MKIDEQVVGRSASEISQRLKDGEPSIYLGEKYLRKGLLLINSLNVDEEVAKIVGEHLHTTITS